MAHYTTTVRSPWSPGEAFEFMADLRNFTEWDPGVSSAELIEGLRPGLGARYAVEANRTQLEYVTEAFDPSRSVEVVAEKAFLVSRDLITIVPTDGGSEITYDARLDLKGPLALLDPLLGLVFNRIGDKAAAGLKKRVGASAEVKA